MDIGVQARAEKHLRLAMRVIAVPMMLLGPVLALDHQVFGGRLGFAWSPAHFEEHGNTTLEFETMICFTYFGLGVTLVLGAADPVMENSTWLLNFCVYGGFGAHAIAMLIVAIWDVDREVYHLMPWGDVPILLVCAGVLYYLKRQFDLKAD